MPPPVDDVVNRALLNGPQPVIRRHGLILRPWTNEDCPDLIVAFRDGSISKWNLRTLDSPAEARALIAGWKRGWKRHISASWAVVAESEPGRILGQVGFRSLYRRDGMAEMSYWVLPQYRRQRIATRAADVLAQWAQRDLKIVRLELVHSVKNRESCGVARAAGFEIEGIKRCLERHEDGWHDMCLHSRITAGIPTPPRALPLRMRVAARLDGSYRAGEAAGRARELVSSHR